MAHNANGIALLMFFGPGVLCNYRVSFALCYRNMALLLFWYFDLHGKSFGFVSQSFVFIFFEFDSSGEFGIEFVFCVFFPLSDGFERATELFGNLSVGVPSFDDESDCFLSLFSGIEFFPDLWIITVSPFKSMMGTYCPSRPGQIKFAGKKTDCWTLPKIVCAPICSRDRAEYR